MITLEQDRIIFILHVLLLFRTGDCYELKCSVSSQRRHRSNNFCSIAREEYMCLLDVIKGHNIELCSKKKEFQRPGYKIVWSGNIDGQTCDTERYQPISHFNLDESNCIFQKSSCNEEGQITVEDGSPRTDRRCRCDYRQGYAFVTEPSNKCNCISSNEDCSCYLKHCPFLQKLSPDYNCVWQDDLQESFTCTTMLERGVEGEENSIQHSQHCILDNSADRNMLIFSFFHADHRCTLHIVYTTLLLLISFGIIAIAFCISGRGQPDKACTSNNSDTSKTMYTNGTAGECCSKTEEKHSKETGIKMSHVITSRHLMEENVENMNHSSTKEYDFESFCQTKEVKAFKEFISSIVMKSRNIRNTVPKHEIDKNFNLFLNECIFKDIENSTQKITKANI